MTGYLYKILEKNRSNTNELDFELSRIMGWAVEMIQGLAVIVDDIMDESDSRRGQTCWHKLVYISSHIIII